MNGVGQRLKGRTQSQSQSQIKASGPAKEGVAGLTMFVVNTILAKNWVVLPTPNSRLLPSSHSFQVTMPGNDYPMEERGSGDLRGYKTGKLCVGKRNQVMLKRKNPKISHNKYHLMDPAL